MQRTWAMRGWLLLSIALGACRVEGDSAKQSSESTPGDELATSPNGEGGAVTSPNDGGRPTTSGAPCGALPAGKVCVIGAVGTVGAVSGIEQVSATVLGQPDGAVKAREDGTFAIALDKGLSPVVSSDYRATARENTEASNEYTLILHEPEGKVGRVMKVGFSDEQNSRKLIDLGAVELIRTGKVAGSVTLAGESDHTGIQVYFPGTSYLGTTAANGQFLISNVPAGLLPLIRAERDGYDVASVAEIEVPSDSTVTVPPLRLGVATGVTGTIRFAAVVTDAQGSYSTDATVFVELVATGDAVLVMLSEDGRFKGSSWRAIQARLPYTFVGDGEHRLYVKFANANGLESSPSSASITIDTDPKVELTSPASSTTNSRPTVDWTDTRITGATYTLQVAEDASFESLVVDAHDLPASVHELTSITLATGTPYFARVRIDDGTPRNWSEVKSFDVDFGGVTLLSPQGAQPSSRPVLDWTDPRLTAPLFHVQVSEGTSFSAPLIDATDLSTSAFVVNQTLESSKQYAFRVAVKDENGVESEFSSAQAFSVDLGTVMLDAPGSPQPDSTPTIRWSASPLPSATYRVQIGTDPSFTRLVDQATALTQNAYTTPVLEQGQSYCVRVSVLDEHGAQGGWAGPVGFGVDLGSVTLSSPAEDALTNDSSPTFDWTSNPIAASYTLSYSLDPTLANATQIAGVSTTQHTLASALPDTPLTAYYWAVTPVDENGVSGTRSAIARFRLDTQPPTGMFALNDGDATTYSEQVRVTLRGYEGSGVVEVMATKTDPDPNAEWVSSSEAIVLDYSTLATTDSATITAYGYLRDAAGNVSARHTAAIALDRTVVQASTLSSDTTWSASQGPYYVIGDVTVLHPATLTLEPGVTGYFKAGKKIEVRSGGHSGEAGIFAVGSATSPITLSGARIELNYADDGANEIDYDGNYVSGPRFDYVQMTDGEIHLHSAQASRNTTHAGVTLPGFYMQNSSARSVSADAHARINALHIERSAVSSMVGPSPPTAYANDNERLLLNYSQISNSRVTTMSVENMGALKIEHCELSSLTLYGWSSYMSVLAHNRIHAPMLWHQASTGADVRDFHDNSFIGEGTVLSVRGTFGIVFAPGTYWGVTGTAEMLADQTNISVIDDRFDTEYYYWPRIDFAGYVTSSVVGAGPDW